MKYAREDVTILVPVLARPRAIKRVARAFDGFPILFLPDANDHPTLTELELLGLKFSIAPIAREFNRATYSSKINHGYRITRTPFILYVGDDVYPHPHWWDAANARLNDARVGVLATNDRSNSMVRNGLIATHGIVRRSYVRQYGSASLPDAGPIFWEGYGHWGCDAELSYVARARDAFAFEAASIIGHRRKEVRADSTYALGQSTRDRDRALVRERCPGWPRYPVRVDPLPKPKRPLVVTMLSAAERRAARDVTLPQLDRHNLRPIISLNTPTLQNAEIAERERERLTNLGYHALITGDPALGYGGRNNMLGGSALVHLALDAGADLLYLEDDVDVAPDVHWFLDEARATPDAITYLYTHDGRGDKALGARYGPNVWAAVKEAIREKRAFHPRGLFRVRDHKRLNSGQAILIPHPALERLPTAEFRTSASPMDMWIQTRAYASGIPLLVALPHPVQHRHDRTGRTPSSNPNKRSQSFDLR